MGGLGVKTNFFNSPKLLLISIYNSILMRRAEGANPIQKVSGY
jgi:hypothetical protein